MWTVLSLNLSIMQTPSHFLIYTLEQPLSIYNSLKKDGMPAFTVEVVTVVLLRCQNGYVGPISGTNTLRKPPPVLSLGRHFFKLLLVWKTNLFWNQQCACCTAKLSHTLTHSCFADTEKMANTSVLGIGRKLP